MSDRKRVNTEGDRLSSLPDDLIHKILSLVSIKQVVETSVLSPRWRFIWTAMPYLSFSSNDFHTLPKFSNFVKHVLLGRNNLIDVASVELTFRGKVNQSFVKRIWNYASSHNVQQLNITCLHEKITEVPLSLFSSQFLKHLTLTGTLRKRYLYEQYITMTPPAWELQALATLNLNSVTLLDDKGADFFSRCANLKNLTLNRCKVRGLDTLAFNIRHPGLSSLTLENGCRGVNVVTPQLKNLTIKNWGSIHLISAPNLSSLQYNCCDKCYDYNPLQLSTELLHLEKVDVCIGKFPHFVRFSSDESEASNKDEAYTLKIVSLLQQLRNVRFLTLNLELVKFLSSSMELISHRPSPFTNLKSLKIYPVDLTESEITMSTEVKNYLIDGSPSATFTIVSYKEVRAVMDVASARNLIGELRVLLDSWKENSETNEARTKQNNAPMESHMATGHEHWEVDNHRPQHTESEDPFLEKMTHIESYWEELNKRLPKGYESTRQLISLLRTIEGILKKVPTSHPDRAKLQARYTGLRAEAETIMESMMDQMKIQCDKKPSFVHELATSSQQCS